MALYLVQHGISLPKDQDPEKGLSEEGRQEVRRIADMAAKAGVAPSVIIHSGKKRAEQTAALFADALGPGNGVEKADGLGPLDDVAAFAGKIDPGRNAMLVGHLPFMERITSYLLIEDADRTLFKFQNGGIVCLDRDEEKGNWFIAWAILPAIF